MCVGQQAGTLGGPGNEFVSQGVGRGFTSARGFTGFTGIPLITPGEGPVAAPPETLAERRERTGAVAGSLAGDIQAASKPSRAKGRSSRAAGPGTLLAPASTAAKTLLGV